MTNRRVIIADQDLNYLLTLQTRLLEEMKAGTKVEAISNKEYFDDFFSIPQDASCLIISEELFQPDIVKHNIDNIIVLAEDVFVKDDPNENVKIIYKYSSLKEILNQLKIIFSDMSGDQIIKQQETQVISFFSPSGGQGCTALSLCLARYFEKQHYNVLYISTQSIQNFQYYLDDPDFLPAATLMELDMGSGSLYGILKNCIRKKGFSYVPQLPSPLSFFGIKKAMFITLIGEIRATNDYDYIIVDSDSVFNSTTAELMKTSDRVCFVVGFNESSIYTANKFLPCIDRKPGQYVFVCNKTPADKKIDASAGGDIAFDVFVPLCEVGDASLLESIEGSGSITKMGIMMDLS